MENLPTFRTGWLYEVYDARVCVLVCISSNSFEWRMSVSSSSSKQRRWIKKGKQSDRNGIREEQKKPEAYLSLTYNEHRIVSVVRRCWNTHYSTYSFHSLAPIVTVQCICSFASNVFLVSFSSSSCVCFTFFFYFTHRACESLHLALFNLFLCFQ